MLTMVFEVLHEGEALIDDNGDVLTVYGVSSQIIQDIFRRYYEMFSYYDDWQEFAIDLSFNPIFVDAE